MSKTTEAIIAMADAGILYKDMSFKRYLELKKEEEALKKKTKDNKKILKK